MKRCFFEFVISIFVFGDTETKTKKEKKDGDTNIRELLINNDWCLR